MLEEDALAPEDGKNGSGREEEEDKSRLSVRCLSSTVVLPYLTAYPVRYIEREEGDKQMSIPPLSLIS